MKNMSFLQRVGFVILGSGIFALSVNWFVVPTHIYNGGLTGTAQLIRDAIVHFTGFDGFDLLGLLIIIVNLPFFIFAWNKLSKQFVLLNLVSIASQAIFLSVIPTPSSPIVGDVFVNIIIAAALGSFGVSLMFRVKGGSGGLDMLGFYLSKYNKLSVGTIYIILNTTIYIICMIVFDVPTAIYSLVYAYFYGKGLDRFHEHNLEASVMIFTRDMEVKDRIIVDMHRGVTCWQGMGAYTKTDVEVLVTVVAQSEVKELRRLVKRFDPQSFIIVSKNMAVDGGFEKRLI
ncbi:YitT family protein [Erysipelothrix urinaevulpis]|uniref:YitT family protein n=1 Tax=Erysipelothrix urinaevulpis TaxID=2683717 RepID=UPI001F36B230|nr:YitT family protein [Erysipelothrix urinaevulpis]